MKSTSPVDPFRPTEANISSEDLIQSQDILRKLQQSLAKDLVGQDKLVTILLIGLLANGHVLLESASGLAKSTTVRVLANLVGGSFSDLHCTLDLTIADVMGSRVFDQAKRTYEAQLGPAFVNFLVLSDFNQAPAKVQSACLTLLEQRQIVMEQMVYRTPKVFFTVATQQPVESEQTNALTTPQLDRFYLKERLNYPTIAEEVNILNHVERASDEFKPVIRLEQVDYLQNLTKSVYVSELAKRYIAELVLATRSPEKYITSDLLEYIKFGASPRASVALMNCSKALALISGHTYVTPHDIQALRYVVFRHRIGLDFSAFSDGVPVEQIIDTLFSAVPIPSNS